MIAEPTKIIVCELKIGNNATTLKIPELNETQEKFFEILKMTPSQMLLPDKWECSN